MKYVIAVMMTPITYILSYMMWVCFLGVIISFLTWDWSIIPNNIFPWQMKEIHIPLRSIAGALGLFGMAMPWVMIEEEEKEL